MNFSYLSYEKTISTKVGNFVDVNDVITNYVISSGLTKKEGEEYLFLLTETYENLFGNFFDNISISHILLFEFSEDIVESYLPHKLDDFLIERRIELDSYFGYEYNSSNWVYIRL